MKTILLSVAILIAAFNLSAQTQTVDVAKVHPHELLGFLLHQDRKAVEAELGKPYNEQSMEGNRVACAYRLPGQQETYFVVFYYLNEKSAYNNRVVQMELTGKKDVGATGFFNLHLGATEEECLRILGKPEATRHEEEVNLDLWDWPSRNYSIEFTPDKKLFSIQITEQETARDELMKHMDLLALAHAIKAHDVELLMAAYSGDLECYSKDYFGLRPGNARKIITDKSSGFSYCMNRAADAILAQEKYWTKVNQSIRIYEKAMPGMVTKFPESSPLQEIVYSYEAGQARVYEVTLR